MNGYVSHLAKDDNPRLTACGEPCQGWQAPDDGLPGEIQLPPHDQPRPHKDDIRFCQACAKI